MTRLSTDLILEVLFGRDLSEDCQHQPRVWSHIVVLVDVDDVPRVEVVNVIGSRHDESLFANGPRRQKVQQREAKRVRRVERTAFRYVTLMSSSSGRQLTRSCSIAASGPRFSSSDSICLRAAVSIEASGSSASFAKCWNRSWRGRDG